MSHPAAPAGSLRVHSPKMASKVFSRIGPGRARAHCIAVAKFFPAWGGAVAALAIPRAEAGRKEEMLFAAAVESIFAQVE